MSDHLSSHKRYMPGLDGLRALALFFVVLYHLNVAWAPGGLLGVSIFFVLSGYLITDLLTAEWSRSRSIDLKSFWIRRCRRLLPAMFVMMAAIVAWVTLFDRSLMPVLRGDVVSSLFYINNWYSIFHQVSYFEKFGPQSPFGHMWSLAVEEQFYLIWPILLLIGMKRMKKRGPVFLLILALTALSALAMLVLYNPDTDPSRVYYGTDTRAFSLLIGAALSIVWPSRKMSAKAGIKTRLALNLIGVAGLVSVFAMVWKTNEYDPFLYPFGFLLLSLLTAMIIASAAHPASFVGKVLGMKPLRWLGVRTYSIYLWHYPVIMLSADPSGDTTVWRALLQSALSVALACLSYKLIEEPIRGGLIGRTWKKLRRGSVNLSLVPFKGWATLTSVLLLVVVSCAGFAIRTPVSASTFHQETAAEVWSPSEEDGAPADPGSDPQAAAGEKPPASQELPGTAAVEHGNGTRPDDSDPAKGSEPAPDQITPPVDVDANPQDGKPQHSAQTQQQTGKSGSVKPSDRADSGSQTEKPKPGRDSTGGKTEAPHDKKNTKGAVPVTAIGDSVMLDAEPYLQQLIPGAVIDGKIGRQMAEAPELVSRLRADGKLGDQVVIELGTNGPFSTKQLMSLLDSLKDVRKVVLVNARVPRSWESVVNASIKKAAAAYPNTTVLDWHAASKGQSYFEPDGVHLKPQGGKTLAELIAQSVGFGKS
ncbi:acyltransferase family protein [Paenibacillus sp. VCA1]|uniref:acyltransferase family protein n=1 Tax=Paenibacillus sp. VCA1 TaxID=3039148 RepID=UPI00287285F2|nr:acyltransferase family protein [Paenibacillus sp. VCA1]MDR9855139.1 acyltransferase family protein [Paenibacillus sp. VCA1]